MWDRNRLIASRRALIATGGSVTAELGMRYSTLSLWLTKVSLAFMDESRQYGGICRRPRETNSLEEQLDTGRDSLLLLRQMVITALVRKARGPSEVHSFLEHPRDPVDCSRAPAATKCSSIWATEVYKQWAKILQHHRIHFDQCRLGQVVQKSTMLSTSLPLHHSLARPMVQPWRAHEAKGDAVT